MTAFAQSVEVTLPHGGRLRGVLRDGVREFRGVRYAQAPAGPLRFAAPVPEPAWAGVRDATGDAPMAPQLARTARAGAPVLGDADCLRVHVWAPPEEPGASWPVMVWVHGGGFFRGSASEPMYDGASFARQGIVFVSVQYRLGVDGFLHFGDDVGEAQAESAPANRGLLDQLAALQWVKDNIHAWGGDAQRITAFGQSAGAGALVCLLGMPQAQGLFQRVILQSPSVACQTLDEAAVVRRAIAHLLGVAPHLRDIAQAPLGDVLYAVHRLAAEPALRVELGMGARQFFPLRPVMDGVVLRGAPLQCLQDQWAQQAPRLQVLVGSNAQEMRLYHVPGHAIDRVTEQEVERFARDAGIADFALDDYCALLSEGARTPGEVLVALQSDYYYRVPAVRIAELAARHAQSVHRYEFEWQSPLAGGRLGAAHGVELPFVFNTLHSATAQELAGPGAPAALAQRMHTAWAEFARSGEPGWPACVAGRHRVMQFGEADWCDEPTPPARFRVWNGIV